jgi:hypothetical protein
LIAQSVAFVVLAIVLKRGIIVIAMYVATLTIIIAIWRATSMMGL